MGRCGDDPAGMRRFQSPGAMRQPLRQVDAVGAERCGQARVRADQQDQAAPSGDRRQPRAPRQGVGGPEGSVDDGGAARQALGEGRRIRRPLRVGEGQQRRQALPPRVAAA